MLRFVQNATRTTIRANLRGCSSLRGNEREVLHLNKGEQKFGFTVFDVSLSNQPVEYKLLHDY